MDSQQRILVIEDDEAVRRTVRLTCESAGYLVSELEDGGDAVSRVESFRPDLILLDIMLPGNSGFDICKALRSRGFRLPIVILSARSEEVDVVVGLEIGADDYILKPFRPRELLARIAAHLRKQREALSPATNGVLEFEGLTIDTRTRQVDRDGDEVGLTHTEFDLLAFLAAHAGQALSRDRILSAVWGYEHPIETRVIDVHVRNLRRKIEQDPSRPRLILAVPGVGYRFAALKVDAAG